MKLPFKLGIHDIETGLLNFDGFALGEQVVRHTQLTPIGNKFSVICVSAKIYGEKEIVTFEGDNALLDFDKWSKKCDVLMGKNNYRFDDKRYNTERLLKSFPSNMTFFEKSLDLEQVLRKYFSLPSYSLDYISKLFGLGGKDKMEFDDWKDIRNYKLLKELEFVTEINGLCKILFEKSYRQVVKEGKAALKKMKIYNQKDILDTEDSLTRILPYVKLSYSCATNDKKKVCRICGSSKLVPTETLLQRGTRYQHFDCYQDDKNPHYAGKALIRYDKNRNKVYGRII